MTARGDRTRAKIKNSMLVLLSEVDLNDITMSELARYAGISRSSLYAHYRNVREVFDENVADFCSTLRPLTSQLHCGDCLSDFGDDRSHHRPFCIALRDAGKYESLIREPSFLPTLLDMVDERMLVEASRYPLDEAMEVQRIKALFKFQMSGCYAVAMDTRADENWSAIQRMLDSYIRAGVRAANDKYF